MESSLMLQVENGPEDELQDSQLVEAARTDVESFSMLYRRYLTRVYRYLRTRVGNDQDAADLTQQTFLKAFDALSGYRDRGLPFAAWLFRIARNLATDTYRRQRGAMNWDFLPEVLQANAEGNPENTTLRQEALGQLRELLLRLDADKRELLALRFGSDLTAREIALILGKSEAAVKKQLGRLLQTLKGQYHDVQ